MPTKKELEAGIRALEGQVATHRHWGHIHSKAADELGQTCCRLRKELATAQERIEELEAQLKSKSAKQGTRWRASLPVSILREARASVSLDKHEDGSDMTQYDEEEAPDASP